MPRPLRPSDGVVYEVLDGQAVVLHLGSGTYYQMSPVATLAWEGIVHEGTIENARSRILGAYDVDAATVDRDLAELVRELSSRGLVVDDPASPGCSDPDRADGRAL